MTNVARALPGISNLWLFSLTAVLSGCPGDVTSHERDGSAPSREGGIVWGDGSTIPEETGVTEEAGYPVPWDTGAAGDTAGWPDAQAPVLDTVAPVDDIGKACTSNADCMFGFCATNTHTGAQFCTKVCDPCSAAPCPSGSGCQDAGLAYICAPGYPDAPCP